jgi:protein disulfide-isomerase-like protein
MSPLSLLFLAATLVASLASDVVTLTTANFDEQTKASTGDNGSWLVEFYAPWCGHCKRLQPIWEELATDAKGQFSVGKVDVTENRDLGTRFEIKGFPTVSKSPSIILLFNHIETYADQVFQRWPRV